MNFEQISFVVIIAFLIYLFIRKKRAGRIRYIENYAFPSTLKQRVNKKYPHLSDDELNLVLTGLRDYFIICNQAKGLMVAMPSQVIDIAWHEFILFTRSYDAFCKRAIGRFLHHTPTEAMRSPTEADQGIKRAWRLACVKENINPKKPSDLPLLFAIDGMLKIEDGFIYSIDCLDKDSPLYGSGYCASSIGCASGCGGSSDSSGSYMDSASDGGSVDSSCGGSSCSSGCGGGD